MTIKHLVKKALPAKMIPAAVNLYLRSHRLYFASYRLLFRPSARYLAVAEQNYVTDFPPEWTSVSIENADIVVDLETDYSFSLDEVKFAYSSHTIEHLSDEAVKRLFRNIHCAMSRGGVLRVECPDLDLLLDDYKCVYRADRKITRQMLDQSEIWNFPTDNDSYAQDHIKLLAWIVSYFDYNYNRALPPLCSADEFEKKVSTLSNSEFGDWAISLLTPEQLRTSHEHRNWFNFDKLNRFLVEAGFSGVIKCEPEETRYGFRMNINRTHRSFYSIYVEAIKQ